MKTAKILVSRGGRLSTLSHMLENAFFKNVTKLTLGVGFGQIITFASAPVITRLYQPDDLGRLGALMAIVTILSTLSSLSFSIAIVVAEDKDEAARLSAISFKACLIITPLVTLVLISNDGWIMHYLGMEMTIPYVPLIPLLALVITINSSAGYTIVWNSAFGISSRASVLVSIVGNSAKIIFGLIAPGTLALLAGNVLGFLIVPMIALKRRFMGIDSFIRYDLDMMKATVARHRDFPLMRTPQILLRLASDSLPVLVLAANYEPALAGQFALSMAMLNAPAALFGNAIQSVFYPRIAQSVREGEDSSRHILIATIGATAAGALPFISILMLGEPVFRTIFGNDWSEAGIFAAILAPWVWSTLAGKPANASIGALGIQKGYLVFELFGSIAKVIVIVAGTIWVKDPFMTITLYVLVATLVNLSSTAWVYARSKTTAL